MPDGKEAQAAQKWLEYPEVVELAYFHPGMLPQGGTDCCTGDQQQVPGRAARPGYRLVAVGNDAGREQLLRDDFADLWHSLPEAIPACGTGERPWPWQAAPTGKRPSRREATRAAFQYDVALYNEAVARRLERCRLAHTALEEVYSPPRQLRTAACDTSRLWRMPAGWALPSGAALEATGRYADSHQLRYDWKLAYFTDGSVQTNEGGDLVGAAVWRECEGAWLVKVNGTGPDDTITRAELAAISHAVDMLGEAAEAVVFTDSLVSIHLLRRAVREPHTLGTHLHRELLMKAAELMIRRANAGLSTRIHKVVAHCGIRGNEAADEAAKRAAAPDAEHDLVTDAGVQHGGVWWPGFFQPSGADGEQAEAPWPVSNLTSALRKALHASTKTGSSKRGLMATLNEEMYTGSNGDRALPKESNAMWGCREIGPGALRNAIMTKWDQHLTRSKAHKRGIAYPPGRLGARPPPDGRCPLRGCTGIDTGMHAQLSCSHAVLAGGRIKRHNVSVLAVQEALVECAGGAYTVLDACPARRVAEHGAASTRLSRWMIPEELASDEELAKLRPDILRIQGLPETPTEEELQHAQQNKGQYTIQVLELGYCRDTAWRQKHEEKQQQHATLMGLLKAAGWQVDDRPLILLVGAGGTVYHNGLDALMRLGLTKAQASRLMTKLHQIAVLHGHAMMLARRRLERTASELRAGVG